MPPNNATDATNPATSFTPLLHTQSSMENDFKELSGG
jgi:hypothetical protein